MNENHKCHDLDKRKEKKLPKLLNIKLQSMGVCVCGDDKHMIM